MSTSSDFKDHVDALVERSLARDEFAIKSLAALDLLNSGWRYGDPDPTDGPDGDGGCEVIQMSDFVLKRAA